MLQGYRAGINDRTGETRGRVADAIAKIGDPAVEPLIEAIGDGAQATFRLPGVNDQGRPVPGEDGPWAQHEDFANVAMVILGKIGGECAIQALIGLFKDRNSAVTARNSTARCCAIAGLGHSKDQRAVKPLIALLRPEEGCTDSNYREKSAVVQALGMIADSSAVAVLRAMVVNPSQRELRRERLQSPGQTRRHG